MMIDSDSEQQLQQRFERLRADGQLCPCHCANCPLRDAATEIDAEGDNEKTATHGRFEVMPEVGSITS